MDFLRDSKYLVFSGGGVNGLCETGCLQAVELPLGVDSLSKHFQGFAGTSVGALMALGVSCGFTGQQILSMFKQHKEEITRDFTTSPSSFDRTLGLRPGFNPLDVVGRCFASKCGDPDAMTFKTLFEASKMEFVVVVTNLSRVEHAEFSAKRAPGARVSPAVSASMAMPLLFPPAQIGQDLFCDGALMMNFPFHAFPPSETVGFWMQNFTKRSSQNQVLGSVSVHFRRLANCVFRSQDDMFRSVLGNDWADRMVQVPSPFPCMFPTNSDDLDDKAVEGMQLQGLLATLVHLHHHHRLAHADLSRMCKSKLLHGV
eukprot:jgi/Bigna1/137784/aug1.41_g12492